MTKIGIILHWGIYSVPAYDNIASARRRSLQNGSEHYLFRLTNDIYYRQRLAGDEYTKKYHKEHYNDRDYFLFENELDTEHVDLDKWMLAAKSINATYILLTSKHHDGYCLWNTNTTTHKSKNDFLQLFINKAKEHNLEPGIYYSWMEFMENPTKDYINRKMVPQIEELLNYDIKRIFFDGDWKFNTKFALNKMLELSKKCRDKGIIINDRIGKNPLREDLNYLENCDYRTYEDRALPIETPSVSWESIQTIGLSWGYNSQQDLKDYKSGYELFLLYNKVKEKNGDFLLNIGPDKNGNIEYNEIKAIIEFSEELNLKKKFSNLNKK